jgi:hypothetical protein
MALLDGYKNIGGRVACSTDSRSIRSFYGFSYIEEMELLREAGLSPLEVIRGATLHAAQAPMEPRQKPIEFGIVRPGLLAGMLLVESESARKPEGVLWRGNHPVARPDGRSRARRRRQVHHQGRHYLRRGETARRRSRDGREAETTMRVSDTIGPGGTPPLHDHTDLDKTILAAIAPSRPLGTVQYAKLPIAESMHSHGIPRVQIHHGDVRGGRAVHVPTRTGFTPDGHERPTGWDDQGQSQIAQKERNHPHVCTSKS